MTETLGLSTLIVSTLQQYGRVPVDFLAKALGRRTPEILDYLGLLEQEGVIERQGDTVGLCEKKVISRSG